MSNTVIRVENLYKEYRLGTISHGTLYRDLQSWWARIRGKEDPNSIISAAQPVNRSTFRPSIDNPHMLALNDVSFEVKRGEVLGIIGRNGAGKSTLLKILSEVTAPTKGTVKIKGRVASLLEVGTGFHPELTGRENIYLNGAILGMTKKEIDRKFDEIVDFAEIEKFIDTPVKRYSSGMYVRLAFAVAAHLEPEILVVDEVLAVGDAQFQKKCLGKMGDVSAKEGRTVLFVSHNMGAVHQLCNRGILLRNGVVADSGTTEKIIVAYLSEIASISRMSISDLPRAMAEYGVVGRIIDAWLLNARDERVESLRSDETIAFALSIKALEKLEGISLVAGLDTSMGYRITTALSEYQGSLYSIERNEVISAKVKFPGLHLKPGSYSLTLGIRRNRITLDHVVSAIYFDVSDISAHQRVREQHIMGDVLAESEWSQI